MSKSDDKCMAVIYACDHGVVGDGVTDNTEAIQAALNAAGECGTVFLDSGTYVVNGTLYCHENKP